LTSDRRIHVEGDATGNFVTGDGNIVSIITLIRRVDDRATVAPAVYLTGEVYEGAKSIYDSIVDRWLTRFRPLLGQAIPRPYQLRGRLEVPVGEDLSDRPGVVLSMTPKGPDDPDVSLELSTERHGPFSSNSEMDDFRIKLEQEVADWMTEHPHDGDFASFTTTYGQLEVLTSMPATKLSLDWLCEDLQNVGLDVKVDDRWLT
jgi:hypothetical protein